MPQGKRKVPFSGKAKKSQLQAKRQGKATKSQILLKHTVDHEESSSDVQKINHQPSQKNREANRYALQFYSESNSELKKQKEYGRVAISVRSQNDLEINDGDYFKNMDFPKRPPWSFEMTLDDIQRNEHRYFTEYVKGLEKNHHNLSYFELNLETWRQLWRVLEMSDVLLIIVDIRYPDLMFPPSLYDYITKDIKKEMIFVLNKIDLAPAALVCAWYNYFKHRYPKMHILLFTSFPAYNLARNSVNKSGMRTRKLKGRMQMFTEGAELLLKSCKDIVQDRVDLSSWEAKIREEKLVTAEFNTVEIGSVIEDAKEQLLPQNVEHELYKNGVLTIGCIGQPNVGKSSLMNALMGRKVVSVSKTPGHTKHFQTIFLTETVRLCDCPGLVFPSNIPRHIQVLMGSYPISQLRESFSTIRYVAERLDIPKLLHLIHPEDDEEWSPYNICEAWAIKRGFITARAARPDIHRAGINLLQMCLSGTICLCLVPPGYLENKDLWENHADIIEIRRMQAQSEQEVVKSEQIESDEYSDDDSDDVEPKSTDSIDEHKDGHDSDPEIPIMQNKFSALMD